MTLRELRMALGRPLLLDGGFGTMVQTCGLSEEDFRGYRYRDLPGMMLGNNEMLSLTRPDVVSDIYDSYVSAGVDLLTANTFSANSISQADYGCCHLVGEMNRQAVLLARQAFRRQGRDGVVVGTVGPTNKSLSISPDIADPARRALTFDQLAKAYEEQMSFLAEAGVDAIMLETIFDTLNAKAGIYAHSCVEHRLGRHIELMLSFTVNDASGRILSGQTLEACVISVAHAHAASVGLNCSFGAEEMLPALRSLRSISTSTAFAAGESGESPWLLSCHPNAGLPNSLGQYDVTPEQFARSIRPMLDGGLVDIVGGCCGTTPRHIEMLKEILCR